MKWLDGITDSIEMSEGLTPVIDDGQGGLACSSPNSGRVRHD